MGWIRHHGIVVTCFSRDRAEKARAKAAEIFPTVSEVLLGRVNGFYSFFVPPDGSKEGWKDSDDGDAERDRYIDWLQNEPELYADWLEYVHDSDNKTVKISRSSSFALSESEKP